MSVGFRVSKNLTRSSLGVDLVTEDGGIANPHSSHVSLHLKIQPQSVISFVINNIHRTHPNCISFHASNCLGIVCHGPYGPRLKPLRIAGVHVQLIKANLGWMGGGGTALQANPRRTPYMFSKC